MCSSIDFVVHFPFKFIITDYSVICKIKYARSNRYASNEINTKDFIIELDDKGLGFALGGNGVVTDQAIISLLVIERL